MSNNDDQEVEPVLKHFMDGAKAMADAIGSISTSHLVEVGQVPKGYVAVPRDYLARLRASYSTFRTHLVQIAALDGSN